MEFHTLVETIQKTEHEVVAVLVPYHFQWSMLTLFQTKLSSCIVIPLWGNNDMERLIVEHQEYFPGQTLVFLFDNISQPDYGFPVLYALYKDGQS